MKCFEATYVKNGSGEETILVGANSLSAAAKLAEPDEKSGKELVKLELTDKVVI
jgi:hypothetical protein